MSLPDLAELARVNASLESAHPRDIVQWAFDTFGDGLVFTASFEDAVLVDVVARVAPQADIVLLDTQYLFAETKWFADELIRRYNLNIRVVHPQPEVVPDNLWKTNVEGCCQIRKVEPLQRALAGKAAWITGVRRVDAPTRANAPIVSYDLGRQLVKINPLATMTDEQMALYEQLEDLPRNPLVERGYFSIGCWPCTRPVAPGEDRRAGRWSGQAKVECGLHV
jgi:phosphoadenosine phosphosulfate reductase